MSTVYCWPPLSRAATEVPEKRATMPVPDHAKRIFAGSAASTRPMNRTPGSTLGSPPLPPFCPLTAPLLPPFCPLTTPLPPPLFSVLTTPLLPPFSPTAPLPPAPVWAPPKPLVAAPPPSDPPSSAEHAPPARAASVPITTTLCDVLPIASTLAWRQQEWRLAFIDRDNEKDSP